MKNYKLLVCCFCQLLSFISAGQAKDLSTLPRYDCSLAKVMAIIGRPTILVSPDSSKGLDAILNDYCGTLGSNCIRKKEAALVAADYAKDLFLVGVLAEFKNWQHYTNSITLINKGFRVNNKNFTDASDGFVFVDSNRIIISGNSLQAVKDAQLALTGGHDLLVTQKGKITFYGNTAGKKFNWFNLQDLKALNYTRKSSALFSAIYISKTYPDTINYGQLNQELKSFSTQFLAVFKIPMPDKKISWFLHSNMQEYGTMSGMFGLTCPGNSSGGFSIRGEIHTLGFNTALVKHEYSHYLFDNSIPQDNNPAFFIEGVVEYVTNLNDRAFYDQRIAIAKRMKDTLNYADLILRNKDFYGRYSSENYSVCGVFVKFIIDKYGVDNFKKYCLASDKTAATKELFKEEFEELVVDYKAWLDKQ